MKLIILTIALVFNCSNVIQDETVNVSQNGKRIESYLKDGVLSCYFYRLTKSDTVTIHNAVLNDSTQVGDSLPFVFRDISNNELISGTVVVNSDSIVSFKNIDYLKLFKSDMAIKLYSPNFRYEYVAFIIYK